MFRYLLILILCLNLYAEVVTTTSVKTIEGQGVGLSRSEAVNSALIEALSQLNGVSLRQEKLVSDSSVESSKGDDYSYEYSNKIESITKGKVDSYKILEVNEFDGKYEAKVKITNSKTTKSYKVPGLDAKNRRSIIVVPANFNYDTFNVLDEAKSSIETNIDLSQELLNAITQTRKFNVLDREENRAFYNEKNIIRSEDANKDELLKLGHVMGSDYILLTSIKNLIIEKEKANKYIASTSESFKASVTVQFKVMVTATRQVKFSNTRTYNFTPKGNSGKEIYYNILSEISNKIAAELMENIYPLQVIEVAANEVTINQGNLIVGSKYEVFKLGKNLVDSYTKESLGSSESKTGVIEIIRVLPKFSVGKIVEGQTQKGDIVRSIYSSQETVSEYQKVGRESNAKISENGGVSLPFD